MAAALAWQREEAPIEAAAIRAPRAIRIVIAGLVGKGATVALAGLDLTRKEMTPVGSRASADRFPESLTLIAVGKVRRLASARSFELKEAPAAFDRLTNPDKPAHWAISLKGPA